MRAVNELRFKPQAIGGAMVGLQATAIKAQFGTLLNGFINYELLLPVPKMQFPGLTDLISRYQARAAAEGIDPLGHYMPPWAYAQLQVLQQAVWKRRRHWMMPGSGIISARTHLGRWWETSSSAAFAHPPRNIRGYVIAQFKDISTQVVVAPEEYASGGVIYPYEKAK